jgi:hypothetical protein
MKQSGYYQLFPDCFTPFAMTGQGFRDIPGMSVENKSFRLKRGCLESFRLTPS